MPVWLHHTWVERLGQLHTGERITVLRNFAWLLVGLYASGSVHLSKVADELPSSAKLPSVTRRLTRLLANPAVRVRTWYEPLAQRLLAEQGKSTGEIRLIVDGSKMKSDIYATRGRHPLTISNVTIHFVAEGSSFDLNRRQVLC